MASRFVTLGVTLAAAGFAYYHLTRETTVKKNNPRNKKKRVTLASLSRKCDTIINNTQNPRMAIVLLENLQLEVDAIPPTTDNRRQRRKQLNVRINESMQQLEKEADTQPLNDMRGYRILKDGTKTTFFHREVTAESKALIGDTTPKRIEASHQEEKTTGARKGSEWNGSGNTWESKNVTTMAKKVLREMLSSHAIAKITGDVTLVVKKKISLIYDVDIILELEGKQRMISLLSGDEPTVEGLQGDALETMNTVLATFETVLMDRVNN